MGKSKLDLMREQANKAVAAAPPADRFARAQALVERQPNGFAEKKPDVSVSRQFVSAEVLKPDFKHEVAEEASAKSVTLVSSASAAGPYYEETDIGQIDDNPFNARRLYRPERVHELAESMRADGQLVPGIATIRDGRRVLAGGHYRLKALKVAGLPTMRLLVHPNLTDQQLYQLSYKENAEREGQSPLDNALAWRSLIDDCVYPNESAIAEVTGMSLSNINKTLAILKLSEPVLEIVREKPEAFALTTLYQLTLLEKVAGNTVTSAMATKIGQEQAYCRDVEEARTRYESKPPRKQKETSRQHRLLDREGKPLGVLKDWDSGKVSFEITLLDPVQRRALVDELKERFASSQEEK
ncbi:ParB/RepB/Spo0J family partition protein [Cupriavidus basilensis]|uniref:ParB/RepB/Spo0J family partition protein n=1 Tax=Cupriavidus basilensis TaxID=68895 RepID=A0ABT6B4Q3_9BURK|nr:ParB/RepB/Spo0J family partition protein [Cupriavidus basilensis]MDF3839864.1 ParB/RepB/Spo0J family partition protein [Cupriavidus basilensis]